MNPKLKKGLITTVKIVIVLLVVVWVVRELHKSWNKIGELDWKFDYSWLVLSGMFYVIAYLPTALFWRYAMRSLGQRPGIYESLRAYFIGHLGKYVPGKALVVVLRSGLLQHDRTRASVAAAAVFLETLTMMASGAFLSALILIVWFRDMPQGDWLMFLALGMMFAAGLPIVPPIFRTISQKLGVGRNDPEIGRKLQGLTFQTMLVGWLLTSLTWLGLGLSLWATILGIGIDPGPLFDLLPRFVLAASLSVVLGFVLMIPGGIGVREFVMIMILTPLFTGFLLDGGMTLEDAEALARTQAIVVAAVQRLISILGELGASALLIRKPKQESP